LDLFGFAAKFQGTGEDRMKSQMYPLVNRLSVPGPVADRTALTGVLEADEVKQIKLATDHENQLDASLAESATMEEEDDELEEQDRVEAAAAANRG
jgi:hypothetical protein